MADWIGRKETKECRKRPALHSTIEKDSKITISHTCHKKWDIFHGQRLANDAHRTSALSACIDGLEPRLKRHLVCCFLCQAAAHSRETSISCLHQGEHRQHHDRDKHRHRAQRFFSNQPIKSAPRDSFFLLNKICLSFEFLCCQGY